MKHWFERKEKGEKEEKVVGIVRLRTWMQPFTIEANSSPPGPNQPRPFSPPTPRPPLYPSPFNNNNNNIVPENRIRPAALDSPRPIHAPAPQSRYRPPARHPKNSSSSSDWFRWSEDTTRCLLWRGTRRRSWCRCNYTGMVHHFRSGGERNVSAWRRRRWNWPLPPWVAIAPGILGSRRWASFGRDFGSSIAIPMSSRSIVSIHRRGCGRCPL